MLPDPETDYWTLRAEFGEELRKLKEWHERDQATIATHMLRVLELEAQLELAELYISRDVRYLYEEAKVEQARERKLNGWRCVHGHDTPEKDCAYCKAFPVSK